jgi:NADH dehydrogenase (ubiquinone) 1 alpha subcomplex subunit 13
MNHKEKRECRMAILPYLAAEHDKNLQVVMDSALKQEGEIMKNVEGWKVGEPIYSKRWLAPLSVTTVEHRRVLSKYGPAGPGL